MIAGVKDERLSDILVQQDDLTLTKAVDTQVLPESGKPEKLI